MGKTLNCNPTNGDLITENTATITFGDTVDSIANIYYLTRRDKNGNIAEFSELDHYSINGIRFDKNCGRSLYDTLWYIFLKKNPSIVEKIRSYDDFSDGMKTPNCINSTARVFYVVKKYGLTGLHNNCKRFMSDLAEKNKSQSKEVPAPTLNNPEIKAEGNTEASVKENAPASENEDKAKKFKELDLMVIGVIKAGNNKYSKEQMISMARAKKYEPLEEKVIVRLLDIRYDEFNKNTTSAYTQRELYSIRAFFLNDGREKDDSKIEIE